MEKETYYLLLNENISFDYQHCFHDCINKSMLPFDFYIPSLNTAIELQGEQYYHSTNFFGGKEKFEMRKKNDIIKEKYCYEHHITLLKIHYLQNIKDTLLKNKIIKNQKEHYFNNKLDNYLLNRLPNIKVFKIYNQYLNIDNYNDC